MSEPIISLSEFKSEASQLLARIRESGEALVLTQNGTATAVVHDIASFRKLSRDCSCSSCWSKARSMFAAIACSGNVTSSDLNLDELQTLNQGSGARRAA
jgi:prevent-host-death family protein